jgi:hypothetical protein
MLMFNGCAVGYGADPATVWRLCCRGHPSRTGEAVGGVPGPLDRIVVETRSPDQNISVTMHGRTEIEMWFSPGAYDRYDDSALAGQLSALATSTWVEYRRRYLAALSEEVGDTVRSEDRSYSPKLVKYQQELAELVLSGTSSAGWVRAGSVGLVRWTFTLHPGACRRLSEAEFVAETHSAVHALLADHG